MADHPADKAECAALVAQATRTYKRMLAISLVVQATFGIACVIAPAWTSELLGQDALDAEGWVRMAGALLLLVTAFYASGWPEPLIARAPNVIGVAGRVWTGIFWGAGGGSLLWLAAIDIAFALLLGYLYLRLLEMRLMAHA